MTLAPGMSHEYRLVVERPEHQQGRRSFTYRKRSLADAERALEDHDAHAQRMYLAVGLVVWAAWIEPRQVGDWERMDGEPIEAVPV